MLNWNWENKIGELRATNYSGEEMKFNLYSGNAPFIAIYEFEEEGKTMYQMFAFFLDVDHAKRFIADDGAKTWTKLTLWKPDSKLEKIAKLLYKNGCDVEFRHKEPTPEAKPF